MSSAGLSPEKMNSTGFEHGASYSYAEQRHLESTQAWLNWHCVKMQTQETIIFLQRHLTIERK